MKVRKIAPTTLVIIVLIAMIGGVSASIALDLNQKVRVSYGEITYVKSDLQVNGFSEVGPGINTQSVDVVIENTKGNTINANVSVYLMDGTSVVSSGYKSNETWNANETRTINVNVDDTKEHQYDQIDIRIREE